VAHLTYADIIPYARPRSLDLLDGPMSGHVRAPINVSTAMNPVFDLDDPPSRDAFYAAVVREGTPVQQEGLLARETLESLWPQLLIPSRCRAEWEAAFPALAGSRTK